MHENFQFLTLASIKLHDCEAIVSVDDVFWECWENYGKAQESIEKC